MSPRTRAPDANGSMEEDRILSDAGAFEAFATHYGNIMQRHKRRTRYNVIRHPPRRSPRLLEKMLKEQQTVCEKVICRSYSVISESDHQALIPVMSLSLLRTKRCYELKGHTSDDVNKFRKIQSESVTEIRKSNVDGKRSIIQIKQDFLVRSERLDSKLPEQSHCISNSGNRSSGVCLHVTDNDEHNYSRQDGYRFCSSHQDWHSNVVHEEICAIDPQEEPNHSSVLCQEEIEDVASYPDQKSNLCHDVEKSPKEPQIEEISNGGCPPMAMDCDDEEATGEYVFTQRDGVWSCSSHQDVNSNVVHEEICTIDPQEDISLNVGSENIIRSPVLRQEQFEDVASSPDQESNLCHEEETSPKEAQVEEISNEGCPPMAMDCDDEEATREYTSTSTGDYHSPFGTQDPRCFTRSDHPESTSEYSQIHGPEPMSQPFFVMPPVGNCWLEANLQPLVQVENSFIRQGAFAIKYGGITTILTGVLHLNSEMENYLFESHFLQPPPNQFGPPRQHFPDGAYPPHNISSSNELENEVGMCSEISARHKDHDDSSDDEEYNISRPGVSEFNSLQLVKVGKLMSKDSIQIRLRSDILDSGSRERELDTTNHTFVYEIHFRDNCRLAFVVHDGVDFLCPNSDFLRMYVRFMLRLSRVGDNLKITEIGGFGG